MRYYKARLKMKRRERKAAEGKLLDIDKAILERASRPRGEDIIGLIGACKPYINRFGAKEFANSTQVAKRVKTLVDNGFLEKR